MNASHVVASHKVRRGRRRTTLAALLVAALASACHDTVEPLPTLSASAPAPDEIDPDALLEGKAEAFGMKLPMRTSFTVRTPQAVKLELPFSLERVANYLRDRVDAESIEVGPGTTHFRKAKVRGADDAPRLDILVTRKGQITRVAMVRDDDYVPFAGVTPPTTAIPAEMRQAIEEARAAASADESSAPVEGSAHPGGAPSASPDP